MKKTFNQRNKMWPKDGWTFWYNNLMCATEVGREIVSNVTSGCIIGWDRRYTKIQKPIIWLWNGQPPYNYYALTNSTRQLKLLNISEMPCIHDTKLNISYHDKTIDLLYFWLNIRKIIENACTSGRWNKFSYIRTRIVKTYLNNFAFKNNILILPYHVQLSKICRVYSQLESYVTRCSVANIWHIDVSEGAYET